MRTFIAVGGDIGPTLPLTLEPLERRASRSRSLSVGFQGSDGPMAFMTCISPTVSSEVVEAGESELERRRPAAVAGRMMVAGLIDRDIRAELCG